MANSEVDLIGRYGIMHLTSWFC